MAKTQDELDKIKAELQLTNKPVFTVTIDADDDGLETRTIFLKKFDRNILSAVQKLASGADALKAVEVFIKNTFIGGDDLQEILGNFDMMRSLEGVVVDLIAVKKATISKN